MAGIGRHTVTLGKSRNAAPLKVLQLSDLHASKFVSLDFIAKAVQLGLSLKPDLVLLTGDFITRKFDQFDRYKETLSLWPGQRLALRAWEIMTAARGHVTGTVTRIPNRSAICCPIPASSCCITARPVFRLTIGISAWSGWVIGGPRNSIPDRLAGTRTKPGRNSGCAVA